MSEPSKMHPEEAPVAAAAAALQSTFGHAPPTALVLGSGLGGLVDQMTHTQQADYPSLGLPGSTVPGHAGRAVVGKLGEASVVVMAGRVHLYEGHPAPTIVRYVRALHRWGVQRILLTCSVGGIRADLEAGQLVVVTDHLNFQRTNPLVGPAFGTRFPDLSTAYHPELRQALQTSAASVGVGLAQGILAAMNGPSYESPAEVRMLRTLGADLVGMSTVPEVLAAAEVGMPAAVLAVVSNKAAGLSEVPLAHEDVTHAANLAAEAMINTLTAFCEHVS